MRIARWKLKRLWMSPFIVIPHGDALYEWLTAGVLGVQIGMSFKWCRWFREHIVLARRYGRISLDDKRIWLFQPGWSLAPAMLSYMVTGRGALITEDRSRLAKRYVLPARTEANKVAKRICASAGVAPESVSRLTALDTATTPSATLLACRADYLCGDLARLAKIESQSVDLCMSMGRLEHFSEQELKALLAEMARILVPGGVGSHIIDHRDHFWYFDPSIHCFHHLTLSEEEWRRFARGKAYRNRLLESDYIRLFCEAGFQVLACSHEIHRHDAEGIDRATLWGAYRDISPIDLTAAVSHIVVRRP